jgi:putative transposase
MVTIIQLDGSKGSNQGSNQGSNSSKMVATISNVFPDGDLHGSEVWLSCREGSNLIGVSGQAIRKACKAGKYTTRLVNGNGGARYEIALSSIPENAQMVWRKQHGLMPERKEVERDQDMRLFDEMPVHVAELTQLKFTVVKLYQKAFEHAGHGQKITAKEAFQTRFNCGEWPHLLEKIGSISWRSIDTHWIPKLRESGGLPTSLAPQYRYTRTGRAQVGITALEAQIILGYYLSDNKRTVADVVKKTNRRLKELGQEPVTESRVRRWIKQYEADHGAMVDMAREGEKFYEDHHAPWMKRNPELWLPGDRLVADGHILNFNVQDPVRRKARRMALIFHEDEASKAIVGWEIMPTESTQAIASSLRRAMLWMGFLLTGDENAAFVPRQLQHDNGTAFKAKFLRGLPGDTLQETGVGGMFEQLRPYGFLGCQFSRPYHGQTKQVERSWRQFASLERDMSSYTGSSIEMKPARLLRGEFMHRDLAKVLGGNIVPTLEEAHMLVAMWVHEHNQDTNTARSRYLKGRSRYEALEDGFAKLMERDGDMMKSRIISETELRFLMMRTETRTLRRNGISLFGKEYISPTLHDMAKGARELIVRYDFDRMNEIAVYHPNGEFIGMAEEWCRNGGHHPAALVTGTVSQAAEYRKDAAFQAELRNGTKKAVRKSVLALAESGFGGFANREIAPAVARLHAQGEAARKQEKRLLKTGTDASMEIPAEFILLPDEPKKEEDFGFTRQDMLRWDDPKNIKQ